MAYGKATVQIVGHATDDIEVKMAGNTEVANFTIAVTKKVKDDERVSFIDCAAWGTTATFVSKYVKRGQFICVYGELEQRSWEKDGQKRSKLEVRADSVVLPPKGEQPAQSKPRDEAPEDIDDKPLDLSEIPF